MPTPIPQLDSRLRDAVMSVLRSVQLSMRESFREEGLSPPQYWALQLIEQEGPLTTGQLSQRLCVKSPTTTGLIDRLVEDRLAERTGSPSDRRVVFLTATARGRARLRAVQGHFNADWQRTITDIPSSRRAEILRALDLLDAHLTRSRGVSGTSPGPDRASLSSRRTPLAKEVAA